jgi:hypothetical protein
MCGSLERAIDAFCATATGTKFSVNRTTNEFSGVNTDEVWVDVYWNDGDPGCPETDLGSVCRDRLDTIFHSCMFCLNNSAHSRRSG